MNHPKLVLVAYRLDTVLVMLAKLPLLSLNQNSSYWPYVSNLACSYIN